MQPPIAFDSIAPQSELVERACSWLAERLAAAETPASPDALAALCVELADAQPAMAALIALGTRLLAVAHKAAAEEVLPGEARRRVEEALAAWRADWHAASENVVRQAQAVLPASGWVATMTRSSLVERTLVAAHAAGRPVRALVSESRPMNEGRALAGALADAGIATWLAVDGALALLLPQAGALLLGADAVRQTTFVSKAGTYGLLLVARELNVPAFVLAQRAKFLPDRCARLTLPRRDASEVWADAPEGVQVVNLPFEEIPLALVRGVVTESGFLGHRELADAAASALVAPELLAPAPPA